MVDNIHKPDFSDLEIVFDLRSSSADLNDLSQMVTALATAIPSLTGHVRVGRIEDKLFSKRTKDKVLNTFSSKWVSLE